MTLKSMIQGHTVQPYAMISAFQDVQPDVVSESKAVALSIIYRFHASDLGIVSRSKAVAVRTICMSGVQGV